MRMGQGVRTGLGQGGVISPVSYSHNFLVWNQSSYESLWVNENENLYK